MNKTTKYIAAALGAAAGLLQCNVVFAENENNDANMQNTEMVYVFQNAKGEVSDVIASDWLKDPDAEDTYTQSECDEELPVDMKITYKLDGEEIEPEELLGKSGHISIRYDFDNHQQADVNTDHGEEKLFVPFSSVTAMLLDNDVFENVEMTNGKIMNDGDHTFAVGIAFPGLTNDINTELEDMKDVQIPDYVELEADVNDFSMEMTVTYVSNALTEEIADMLQDGDNGNSQFLQDISLKVADLLDGVSAIKDGAYAVNDGMIAVNDGVSSMHEGLNTLTANSASLTEGAGTVFQSLLDTAYAQIIEAGMDIPAMTIDNYTQILAGLLEQLNPERLQEQALEQVTSAVTEQVQEQVMEQVIYAALNISKDDYEAACAAGKITKEQQGMIEQTVADTMEHDDNVKIQLASIVKEQLESEDMQEKLAAATAGYEKIQALKSSLDDYQTFYSGVLAYTNGVDTAAAGAAELAEGTAELTEGTGSLAEGTASLEEGVNALEEIPAIIMNIENIMTAAKGYSHYSGQNSDVDGEVHFVYRTAEIG